MSKLLVISCSLTLFLMAVAIFPDGPVAALTTSIVSAVAFFLIRRNFVEDKEFLTQVFLAGLLARLLFGLLVHIFELRDFFGGDANTYDILGNSLIEGWFNSSSSEFTPVAKITSMTSGWGMNYLVAFIYSFTGRNILAAQSFCGVIGAATAPLIYKCAHQIFDNRRVGKFSALLVALYPAFIIWSGQLLKDGLIIFLLVLAMVLVIKLQQKFSPIEVILLILSIFGIYSLRFYIFYMAAAAVVGTFVVGAGESSQSILKRGAILFLIGVSLAYIGITQKAGENLNEFTDLNRLQRSRKYQASTESGYGEDIDVSTSTGAITALPIGFTYLMLAPFPWQASNIRQAITIPETLLWWISLPFGFIGLFYTVRHRLRRAIAILAFSVLLTVAYSIFQGNVGTAYRQRTQIQVFLFIFIAVGWELKLERQENLRISSQKKNQKLSLKPAR